jgi:hypothetical protein
MAMTHDTEQRIKGTVPAETVAKPPPQVGEERDAGLFQTMDELRARHSNGMGAKHRIMHAAAALVGGSLLFATLYALILFLE